MDVNVRFPIKDDLNINTYSFKTHLELYEVCYYNSCHRVDLFFISSCIECIPKATLSYHQLLLMMYTLC